MAKAKFERSKPVVAIGTAVVSGAAASENGLAADATQQGEGATTLLVQGAVTADGVADGTVPSLKLGAGAITADPLSNTDAGAQHGSTAIAPVTTSAGTGDQSNAAAGSASTPSTNAATLASAAVQVTDQTAALQQDPASELLQATSVTATRLQADRIVASNETERRRFVILSRVRLNNRMHPVGAPVRITKSEHEQLAKASAVDPDWDDHED